MAELRAQDQLFDAMFRTAGIGMSLTDQDGRLLRVNPTWCAIFGYRDNEVIGWSSAMLAMPKDRARVAETFRRFLSGPLPAGTQDWEAVTKSGEVRTVTVGTTRFVGRDGRIYLLHNVVDVTELRRQQEALVESESWLKEAQRLGRLGYSRTDLTTGVMAWSPELYEIHGVSPKTFCPTLGDWHAMIHPDDRANVVGAVHRIAEGTSFGQCDYRIIRPSGEMRWLHSEWRVRYDQTGRPAFCFSVHQDVTELRRREEELQRANLSKTRFLATAGHDLLQPLEAIGMFIGALDRHVSDPRGVAVLQDLRATKNSMRRLLRSLLDFAALETGGIRPHPRPIAVGPLLRQLCDEYLPIAAQKGLELRLVDSSATIRSDPVLLDRLLRNLLSNAVRYTPAGGILVGCRRRSDSVLIAVTDTGTGIARSDQGRIFEEFEQLDSGECDRSAGVGLGLTIADGLARLLGHAIEVRSAVGKGSTFAVAVPRAGLDYPDFDPPARCMASTA